MAKRAPSVTKKVAPKPAGVGGTIKGGKNNITTHSPHATNAVVDQGAKGFKMGVAPGDGSFASTMINQFNKGQKVGQGKVGGGTVAKRPMGV